MICHKSILILKLHTLWKVFNEISWDNLSRPPKNINFRPVLGNSEIGIRDKGALIKSKFGLINQRLIGCCCISCRYFLPNGRNNTKYYFIPKKLFSDGTCAWLTSHQLVFGHTLHSTIRSLHFKKL